MKTVQNMSTSEIRRVRDREAEKLIKQHPRMWFYVKKSLWKADKRAGGKKDNE